MTDNGKKLQNTSETMLKNFNEMEAQCLDKVKGKRMRSHMILVSLLEAYIKTTERIRSLADELLCSDDEDDKDVAVGVMESAQDIKERGELLIDYLLEHEPQRG